ncbi:MAG: hypothetical protein DDT19_02655 [Syntrophomonadaceae bacterium]|nr:hypothetical protein [Bacillota bacterium]
MYYMGIDLYKKYFEKLPPLPLVVQVVSSGC